MKLVVAVFVAAFVAVVASCVFLQGAGDQCTKSSDCAQPLGTGEPREACVFVDHAGECVPVVAHEQTTCAKGSDCDLALFPIEAKCEARECHCDVVDNGNDTGAVVDHAHCACSHGNVRVLQHDHRLRARPQLHQRQLRARASSRRRTASRARNRANAASVSASRANAARRAASRSRDARRPTIAARGTCDDNGGPSKQCF